MGWDSLGSRPCGVCKRRLSSSEPQPARYASLNRHVHKMEIKAREREAEEKLRLEEAERTYEAELQRMLDKAQALRIPRLRSL